MIVTIEKGCPICGGDLKGSKRAKYFCKNCNILFSEKSLVMAGKIKGERSGRADSLPAKMSAPRFVASSKSNRFHSMDCWLGKRVKDENRVFFNSGREAKSKGFVGCKRCVTK